MADSPPQPRPHLAAALIALVAGAAALAAVLGWSRGMEQRYVHAMASEFTDEKLQGLALQRAAFEQPDLLPFYGSSELVKEMPNNAKEFFAEYPTGFRVFAVGKPGASSLAILQKVAAAGGSVRDRKLALSISPGWFFTEQIDPKFYEGNFSALQAGELAFSDQLSRGLKRDIARRMLAYPQTLDGHWLTGLAIESLADDTAADRAVFAALWPLGKLQCAVGRAQDHIETALHIAEEDERLNPVEKRGRRVLNWNELLKRAAQFANAAAVQAKRSEVARKKIPRASRDRAFLASMSKAREWTDLDLLMRVFEELGAKPLLLTMPIEDIRLEVSGLSPAARDAYTQRLDRLAGHYHFPLRDFAEHTGEPGFMVDFLDHLSGEGWLHYNKALDDFWHGRLSAL